MQIMITHGSMARTRVLRFNRWQLLAGLVACAIVLTVASAAVYHLVFMKAARDGWPVVSQIVQVLVKDEFSERDRYMRQNLDAMAVKLGEMQAKLVRLEALRERVSELAGVPMQEMSAPATALQPARTRSGPSIDVKVESSGRSAEGGPFIAVADDPTGAIMARLGALNEQADLTNDHYSLIESRLFEKRLQAVMIPNSRPVDAPWGSGFGFRLDPFSGRAALHTGLDFPADTGTPILSAAGGVVVSTTHHPQYGQMVELDHGQGLTTRYAHASKVLVRTGDLVKRGQLIAHVGSSGRSTGPHLHFEVLLDGVHQDPSRFLATGRDRTATRVTSARPPGEAAAAR